MEDTYTKPVITVPPGMDVKYVASLMAHRRLSRVVVLEGADLAGIITMNDIVGEVLAMAESARIDTTGN